MKIILEGCDGTGKTTLAKILAGKYGLDVVHCTQADASDYDFYRQTLRKENVVWDRHTLGELIYPYVFNRKANIGVEDARLVMHYAKQEGVIVLVLTVDDDDVIEERLMARGNEHPSILRDFKKINEQFLFYAKAFHLPVIDTTKMTLDEIFNFIEEKEIA